MSGAPAGDEGIVDVAVGVLIDRHGRFLLTSRPAGKVYAGWWEFPGGKLERGESVAAALARELQEELGIEVLDVRPWNVTRMDYGHARVRLHFCKVLAWRGEFEMREGQAMAWQTLPVTVAPVLPGTLPVLDWFACERGFVGPTCIGEEGAATLKSMSWLDDVKWDANGLVPAVAQEVGSNDVLMVAFMNREALAKTAELGEAVYWSRSRARLWRKGEESGHIQKVKEMRLDCDNDVILLKVEQTGALASEATIACHTGRHSCFFQRYEDGAWRAVDPVLKDPERIYR